MKYNHPTAGMKLVDIAVSLDRANNIRDKGKGLMHSDFSVLCNRFGTP